MKKKLLALMLLFSSSLLGMEKEKYVCWPEKQQTMEDREKQKDVSVEKEESIETCDKILDVLNSIISLSKELSHPNTQHIVEDIIFNNYKNTPNDIVELLTMVNKYGHNKELGDVVKIGCIRFIANAALRMSDISSVTDNEVCYYSTWGHPLSIPKFYATYNEFVSKKSGWFTSDDEVNFAKPYLAEQTRKACTWLDSLKLSDEDSELVAATIFEENLNERIAAKIYQYTPNQYFLSPIDEAENKKQYPSRVGFSCQLNGVHYSHDNKMVALKSNKGIILRTPKNTIRFGYPEAYADTNVLDLSFSPDDRLLAVAHGGFLDRSVNRSIRLYKMDKSKFTSKHEDSSIYILHEKSPLINGKFLEKNLSSDVEKNIPHKRMEYESLDGHTADVLSLDMRSDGKSVLSGSADKTVRIWDLNKVEKPRWSFDPSDTITIRSKSGDETRLLNDAVTDVGFSSVDENVFFTASKATKVWDIRSKRPVLELSDEAVTVDQSPDGTQLLIAGNIGDGTWTKPKKNGVRIYNITAGRYPHEFYFYETVKEARYSPKSSEKFFTRYHNGNVQFWVVDGDKEYIKMDRRDLNPGKNFITTACTYFNDGNNFAKVGYFALSVGYFSFSECSGLIECKLSDSSKRELGIGFSAKRALETRYTQAIKEQAQRAYQPKDY